MPPSIRSKSLSQLYRDLGYCGKSPGRDRKVLDTVLGHCDLEILAQGSPLPLLKPDSKEAKALALQALNTSQRGAELWPDNTHGHWSNWSTRRKKHITNTILQEWQKRRRKRPKINQPGPTSQAQRLFSSTHPHEKPRTSTTQPMTSNLSDSMPTKLRGCNLHYAQDHIDSILPGQGSHERKRIVDFTKSWLHDEDSLWPVSADTRLCRLMHAKGIYAEPITKDMEAIVKTLITETEIESLPSCPSEYSLFEKRVLERVRYHAQTFLDKGLIGGNKGQLRKTGAFQSLWQSRHSDRGKQDTSPSSPLPLTSRLTKERPDLYDADTLPVEHNISNKRKLRRPLPSAGGQPQHCLGENVDEPLRAISKIRNEISNSDSDDEPIALQSKRRRFSGTFMERDSIIPTGQPAEMRNNFNNRHHAGKDFAESPDAQCETDLLATDVATKKAVVLPRPSNFTRGSSLTTPLTTSRALFPGAYSPLMISTPPELSATTPTQTPIKQSAIQAPQITLVLPDLCGNLDFDNLVPASTLRDSNLVTFFNFFAQKTGVPIESFECLTFPHSFAASSVKVVYADENDEVWNAFKRNLKRAFVNARNKFPAKTEFDIWVERGDTRGEIVEEDNGGL
ncbi:hypothetical protein N431DRAFT_457171 [Stipitochalara longipes BDJ]|nr:hypothetical protein N431DRAFT_457171 [Stipitochalara longipes BDJ]